MPRSRIPGLIFIVESAKQTRRSGGLTAPKEPGSSDGRFPVSMTS